MKRGGLIEKGRRKRFDESRPALTVITVVKNDCAFIENTIKSVIGQSYCNIEYIIIDGGSTDGTLDIIRRYEDQIDLWLSEPDAGVYDAMNKAISLASSGWLNFMNSGDVFASNQIVENVFSAITDDSVKFIYSDAYMRDYSQEGGVLEYWWTDFDLKSILHQCVIYKKELHAEFGKYISRKGFVAADYFLFHLIPGEVVTKFTGEAIAIYRTDAGISTSPVCQRQVLCIDYLFGKISFSRLVCTMVVDLFVPKRKRNEITSVLIRGRNKIRSMLKV